MRRLWIWFVVAVALAAMFAGRLATARATDTDCTRWEVKFIPMKAEHENALRAGKAAGPLAVEDGWEPFGMGHTAVAARRCAQ